MRPKNENQYPALDRAKADIEAGDLGKARERLTGLLHAHSHDLTLRPKLAEIYWMMKWPEEAGAYWYLEPEPNEDMQKAIAIFEQRCKNDPVRILERLKLRVNFEQMPEGYAKDRIASLQEAIRNGGKVMPAGLEARLQTRIDPNAGNKRSFDLFTACCSVAVVVVGLLVLVGLSTVGDWIFGK